MKDEVCLIVTTIIMLVIGLGLMLPGFLTTGWAECYGIEFGLFEVCIPGGLCSSYTWSEGARDAAKGMILVEIVAVSICLIYSVIRLILILCEKDRFKAPWIALVGTILLCLGAIICIVGIIVFSEAFSTPLLCFGSVTIGYSAYITGTGAAITLFTGCVFGAAHEITQIDSV